MISLLIQIYGSKWWYKNDQIHRTNGPANIYSDGQQTWYLRHQRHRTSGPAVIYSDGTVEYWINGRELSDYELMFLHNIQL